MRHSSEIIISDTSYLILLGKIDEIDVLHRLCERVYLTPTIKEVLMPASVFNSSSALQPCNIIKQLGMVPDLLPAADGCPKALSSELFQ